jgi:curved DNA-binding protein CbpA
MFSARSLPAPTARGTLASRPAEHLFLYVRQKGLSGTLSFGESEGVVGFERGNVRKIATRSGPYLSSVLYEMNLVDVDALNRSLGDLARAKQPHGMLLLAKGLLEPAQLRDALTEQMNRKLAGLMQLEQSTLWAFQENYDALETFGGDDWPLVDPLGGIWRGIQLMTSETELMTRVTSRARAGRLSLRPSSGVALGYLTEEERVFATRLGEGRPYVSVATNLNEQARTRVLYFLLLASAIEVKASEPAFAAIPDAAPNSQFPPNRVSGVIATQHPSFRMPAVFSGQSRERVATSHPRVVEACAPLSLRRQELLDLGKKVDAGCSPFELLGVTADAKPEQIRAQFLRISRQVHPDKLPEELRAYEALASRVMAKLSESYATLSDPAKRAEEARHASTMVREDALVLSRQALKLLERELGEAVNLAKRAGTMAGSDNAEVLFNCAWVLAHEPTELGDDGLRGSIVVFDRLLREHTDYALGFYFRAQLHKRLGNAAFAIRDLKAAVDADEEQLEATRELRLFRMRIEGGLSPEEALGITTKAPEKRDSLGRMMAALKGK